MVFCFADFDIVGHCRASHEVLHAICAGYEDSLKRTWQPRASHGLASSFKCEADIRSVGTYVSRKSSAEEFYSIDQDELI
jgi:hypothetical protein